MGPLLLFAIGDPDFSGGGDPCPPCDCDDGGATFGAAVAVGYNGPATPAPDTEVVHLTVLEDSNPTLLRRVRDVGGYVNTDNVVQVTLAVFDLDSDTPRTPIVDVPLGVQETLFASLQLDSAWDYDAQGYNFRHKIWRGLLPTGGHTYRLEYTIEVLSEDIQVASRQIPLLWQIHTIPRMGA